MLMPSAGILARISAEVGRGKSEVEGGDGALDAFAAGGVGAVEDVLVLDGRMKG